MRNSTMLTALEATSKLMRSINAGRFVRFSHFSAPNRSALLVHDVLGAIDMSFVTLTS